MTLGAVWALLAPKYLARAGEPLPPRKPIFRRPSSVSERKKRMSKGDPVEYQPDKPDKVPLFGDSAGR